MKLTFIEKDEVETPPFCKAVCYGQYGQNYKQLKLK